MESLEDRIKQLVEIFKDNGGVLDIKTTSYGNSTLGYNPRKLSLNIWDTEEEIYKSLVKWCYENKLTLERDIVIVKDYFDL